LIPIRSNCDKTDYEAVLSGLNFILRHFKESSSEMFPRKIMTCTLGYQKEVHSIDEAMQYFAESYYLDCRIRAYPDPSVLSKYLHQNEIPPHLIMMDIDKSHFQSNRAFENALNTVRTTIHEEIDGKPTVLWSGNGYHVIQPINAIILENLVELRSLHENPSPQFLRFADWYLSNGKSDMNHCNTLSFGNCLLRVPGSHNSKLIQSNDNVAGESTKVKIIQKWNGNRPNIKLLLGTFHAYLVEQTIKAAQEHGQQMHKQNVIFRGNTAKVYKILWIERLLQRPLLNYRKYCIWRILTPYLVNVRKLSDEDTYSVIEKWLERCDSIARLSFVPMCTIRYNIRNARKIGYYPVSWNTLRIENIYLYNLLKVEREKYYFVRGTTK
jgi:Primase X